MSHQDEVIVEPGHCCLSFLCCGSSKKTKHGERSGSLGSGKKALESTLLCPVMQLVMRDPCVALDGWTYEVRVCVYICLYVTFNLQKNPEATNVSYEQRPCLRTLLHCTPCCLTFLLLYNHIRTTHSAPRLRSGSSEVTVFLP